MTINDTAALRRAIERAIGEFLAGRKTQRGLISDIQRSGIRSGELAALFASQKGKGDAAKYDAAFRECQAQGWL
ncbi:MAG: hypothetical protein HY532_09670 [Chloroflexi bacterium]|nr:hypothetical protein [Chloroflexota bacterium]